MDKVWGLGEETEGIWVFTIRLIHTNIKSLLKIGQLRKQVELPLHRVNDVIVDLLIPMAQLFLAVGFVLHKVLLPRSFFILVLQSEEHHVHLVSRWLLWDFLLLISFQVLDEGMPTLSHSEHFVELLIQHFDLVLFLLFFRELFSWETLQIH